MFPAVAVFQDALRGVGHVQAGALHEVPDAVQLALDLLQLRFDGLQSFPFLLGHAVHLLVHQLHQLADVGLGEDVIADVLDDNALKVAGVEPGAIAGVLALLEEGVADVVGVFAALGLGGGHGLAAGLAAGQAAEQVGAGGAAGVGLFRGAGTQQFPDLPELLSGYDGGEGVLHSYRLLPVPALLSPDESADIGFVVEHVVDGGLDPLLAVGVGDALGIQGLGDVQDTVAVQDHIEDAAGHGVPGRVEFQAGAFLGAVLDVDLAVAVGSVGGDPEAPGGGLAHSPHNLLGKILAVIFVHGLDDALQQPAGGVVLGLLGD
ncbi:MAG: hypothetical protein OXI54_02500 [Chloroflexota bacterium]|nr:hypothetical protein [Chloroflexota bacterium]